MARMASHTAAEAHVESIRRDKFSITSSTTVKRNPLTADLHNAVQNLSAELYAKDVHFLMELIQNAEDNEYPTGVEPSIEFIITSKDIAGTGARSTLVVFNNEVGFSKMNIESICSIGLSTKKGRRREGFIGEKGIGFKSVFLVSKRPYIFSNGYQIRFSDEPDQDCGIGYIVPEWVEDKPIIEDIRSIYGPEKQLPTTIIILPLRHEKVNGVKKQLSEVHPELLLFLSNIKRLSVKEIAEESVKEDTLCSISVSSRTNLVSSEHNGSTSWYVELSSHEERDMKCLYYMWRQSFPVKPESRINARREIDTWNVSLAFPLGERLNRGAVRAGIYSFLPTNMVTNFSFIIHSDFMLASSRETILLDNAWNLGILGCVGPAFVHAFESYVNSHPLSAVTKMFHFIPSHASSFPVLNDVRKDIKDLIMEKDIFPFENYHGIEMKKLCKPNQVVRVLLNYRNILRKAKEQGLSLRGVSSQGRFVLHSSIDKKEYEHVLEFLGVSDPVNEGQWYRKCIESCQLATELSDDLYVELLYFIMDYSKNSKSKYFKPDDIPLRYMKKDSSGNMTTNVTLLSKVCYTQDTKLNAWFETWSSSFRFHTKPFFIPDKTHMAINRHFGGYHIRAWLSSVNRLEYMDMNKFLGLIGCSYSGEAIRAIRVAHFLYHTYTNKLVDETTMMNICKSNLRIVDSHGGLHVGMKGTLLPSSRSNWGKLFDYANPFVGQNIIDLSEVYADERTINRAFAPKNSVLDFLIKFTGAMDIPRFHPPDIELPIVNSELTCEQVFLLLDWVRHIKSLNSSMPRKFESSIRLGKWMKTISGFENPQKCFLANGIKSSLVFRIAQSLPGFAVIDEKYYGDKIASYGDLLKSFGVTLATEDSSCTLIMKHFVSLMQAKKMSREPVISLLKLLKHLNKHKLPICDDQLVVFRDKCWLVTSQGIQAPSCSFLVESNMDAIAKLTVLPVICVNNYGDEIGAYKDELGFLGVVVDMEEVYKKILVRIRLPQDASQVSRESTFLLLNSIRKLGVLDISLFDKIKNITWIKTTAGYKYPHDCILYENQWGLLTDFSELPLIDESFYGEMIISFKEELKTIGVVVNFEEASKKIMALLKSMISNPNGPTRKEVLVLLSYMKNVRERMPNMLSELVSCLSEVRFLKTRHGFKFPCESILLDSDWGSICMYVDLPLIDDVFYGISIYSYRNELELLGVVVDFSEGPHFVVNGLNLPRESLTFFSSKVAFMIIQCASLLMKRSNDNSLPDLFLNKVRECKWLKTRVGYKLPTECILVQKSLDELLRYLNVPFLDHEFYGPSIFLYKDTLKAIGVIVETHDICSHVYNQLLSYNDNHVIKVGFEFLRKIRWKPTSEELNSGRIKLWVNEGNGKWVPPINCVLHDKENLFGSNNHALYFLDKHYNKQMLKYFSFAFDISECPSIDEHLSLWNSWESNSSDRDELTAHECCLFWEYIVQNWGKHDIGLIKEKISMVPCTSMPGGSIRLVCKEVSAIADNLELVNLFNFVNEKEPLFVWYPIEDLPSLPLKILFEIYQFIGVRKLSEMVVSRVPSHVSNRGYENQELKKQLIKPGLLKIILGFLSGPSVRMPLNERREAALSLLNIKVCESNEPMVVNHVLEFHSSERRYHAKGSAIVLFNKTAQTLFVHGDTCEKRNTSIDFITYFARAISRLFPLETASLNNELCHLIQKGVMFGFDEEEVKFILKTENLQIFQEDDEFINTVFSAGAVAPVTPLRRSRRGKVSISDVTPPPGFSHKKQKVASNIVQEDDEFITTPLRRSHHVAGSGSKIPQPPGFSLKKPKVVSNILQEDNEFISTPLRRSHRVAGSVSEKSPPPGFSLKKPKCEK